MKYWIYIWLALFLITAAVAQPDTLICGSLVTSWNLVSIPVVVTDWSASTNFGVPYVFEYIVEPWIGYRPVDTLKFGHSYWIRNNADRSVCSLGKPKLADTVDVRVGVNFIGSLSKRFVPDTTTLHVIPSGTLRAYPLGCDWGPCFVEPGQGFLVIITSEAPNPRLVMRVK